MAKKILGLDLGVTSIGWSLIEDDKARKTILGMGSRIVPLSTDDKNEFSSGLAISKNQIRTKKRTQRKGYDRYQLRRKYLQHELINNGMMPDEGLRGCAKLQLWGLRAKAVREMISLPELGRVLLHLNQKRGYKSGRTDNSVDRKETEYVEKVMSRYENLKAKNLTIGQLFYLELSKDDNYRTKQQVFPREAYVEEFDKIMKEQKKHHSGVLTDEFIARIRNEIIYYQRKLKSQKGLVSVCEFEGRRISRSDGKDLFVGPKVAPRSSPVFQVCKLWESVNSIRLQNKKGEEFQISIEKKHELFNFLNNNERMTQTDLFKILEIRKSDNWYANKQISRGIQGNVTKALLAEIVGFDSSLLAFNLNIEKLDRECFLIDRKSGEVLASNEVKVISSDIEKQPLYQLWHTIYSISDIDECKRALEAKYGLNEELASKFANVDFSRFGFSNKSVKSIRKILPYLMEGYVYSDAASFAGYNHSGSLTSAEHKSRVLKDWLPNLSKNSLRQPVVEKILNQLINIINRIIKEYGRPDEIIIELGRELKQSKDERKNRFNKISRLERENKIIRERLQNEYGIRATRNNIIKWRLFHEINNSESKANASCIYCGKSFGITDALKGNDVDIEHIIPKSLLFDDSQNNKTLSHRLCNSAKGNNTAYDYMSSKGDDEFREYIERVDRLFKSKIINKAKRDKLLIPKDKIPKDFIERQLRETQFIARKAKELLEEVCYNVWSTSGSVTEYLRRIWGWDDVLMNLQLPKYRELGLTEWVEWDTNDGQKHKKEIITGWTKRDDHRHHAIDALTIACTQRGFVQRINKLSADGNRKEMYESVKKEGDFINGKLNLLEAYLLKFKPFSTKEIEVQAAEILVSFKSGKKAATFGTRRIRINGNIKRVQEKIIIPRGQLSEEQIYGMIKMIEKEMPLKYLFENPDMIVKPRVRELVYHRLKVYNDDSKKALLSLKKDPIYIDKECDIQLKGDSCFKNEVVYKYPVETLKQSDIPFIVDGKVREIIEARFKKYNYNSKLAFKNLDEEPLWYNKEKGISIRSVRVKTNLSAVEVLRRDQFGNGIGFVKPGNNHHIAFYTDEKGNIHEHLCTFWQAVERKLHGIDVIIRDPKLVWNNILQNKNIYPAGILEKLPSESMKYELSLQQNEMFVFGLSRDSLISAIDTKDYQLISDNLYLTWSISEGDYWFRHHLETKNSELKNSPGAKESKRYYRLSVNGFFNVSPNKVYIDCLGNVSLY